MLRHNHAHISHCDVTRGGDDGVEREGGEGQGEAQQAAVDHREGCFVLRGWMDPVRNHRPIRFPGQGKMLQKYSRKFLCALKVVTKIIVFLPC